MADRRLRRDLMRGIYLKAANAAVAAAAVVTATTIDVLAAPEARRSIVAAPPETTMGSIYLTNLVPPRPLHFRCLTCASWGLSRTGIGGELPRAPSCVDIRGVTSCNPAMRPHCVLQWPG